jgi:UDP-N-acetylglucosamine diphosphorylase/glucosamine-1-phosphate N-acetyltransferase
VIAFEDDKWPNFMPLSLFRHTSELRWGTGSLRESLARLTGKGHVSLWGRAALSEVHAPEDRYNSKGEGDVLLVNARAKPLRSLAELLAKSGRFSALTKGEPVAARVKSSGLRPGVMSVREFMKATKGSDRLEAPQGALFTAAWELAGTNGLAVADQATHFPDPAQLRDGVAVKGPASSLAVHPTADVEPHTLFDTRLGPVVVDEGAVVESFSRVSGPTYIGPRSRVASGLIRGGTSIFEQVRVGGEVESSILMSFTNKEHSGYVGHSVVGEWTNLGAGSVFSNLKNTYGSVRVRTGASKVDTGLVKVGAVVGDMAKVSIGAQVFAGISIGTGSHVTGLASTNVPCFTYHDGHAGVDTELLLESVLETQGRMMERRGRALSRPMESLIRAAFKSTAAERRAAGVRKGRLG